MARIGQHPKTRKASVPHPRQLVRNWRQDLLETFNKAERDHDLAFHRGMARENALRQILRTFLPKRFGVATGYVVSAQGERSCQADVILYDALEAPILAVDHDRSSYVIPVESVFGIVEVKSTLTERALLDAYENAHSFKHLANDGTQFACAVYYRLPELAKLKRHGGKQGFLDNCSRLLGSGPASPTLDSMLVLQAQNEIKLEVHSGRKSRWMECGAEALIWLEGDWLRNTDLALVLFLDWLLGRLRSKPRIPPDMTDYLFERGVDFE